MENYKQESVRYERNTRRAEGADDSNEYSMDTEETKQDKRKSIGGKHDATSRSQAADNGPARCEAQAIHRQKHTEDKRSTTRRDDRSTTGSSARRHHEDDKRSKQKSLEDEHSRLGAARSHKGGERDKRRDSEDKRRTTRRRCAARSNHTTQAEPETNDKKNHAGNLEGYATHYTDAQWSIAYSWRRSGCWTRPSNTQPASTSRRGEAKAAGWAARSASHHEVQAKRNKGDECSLNHDARNIKANHNGGRGSNAHSWRQSGC